MHLIAALGMLVAVVCIIGRAVQIGVENQRAHRAPRR